MSEIQNHKIHTASLQVDFEGMEEGLGVQDSLGLLFYEKMKPALEKAFDKYGDPKATIVFDKLELDCGQISYENWEEDLLKQVLIQLEQNLKSLPKGKKETVRAEKKAEEVFFFFLRKGYFPWNSPFSSPIVLENAILLDTPFFENLKKTIQKSSVPLDRIFVSFSAVFISKIFESLTQKSNPKIVSLVKYFQTQVPSAVQKELMVALLHSFPNQPPSSVSSFLHVLIGKFSTTSLSYLGEYLCLKLVGEQELREILDSLLSQTHAPDFRTNLFYLMESMVKIDPMILQRNGIGFQKADSQNNLSLTEKVVDNSLKLIREKDYVKPGLSNNPFESEKNITPSKLSTPVSDPNYNSDQEIEEEIFVENAGLVLLHPFLTGLFSNLQLTENGKFVAESDQSLAARMLQFLVFGENEHSENFYPLNKILCGMGVSQILDVEIDISREFKIEGEELLQAVIGHWSVLKNTSIDGLRETFLQRNGKISRVEKGWKLQVERKTVDVLMAKLPWGMGIIKLPWMNEMIFVEWE